MCNMTKNGANIRCKMVKLLIYKSVIHTDACAYMCAMIRPVAWINIRRNKWGSKVLKKPDNAYFFAHKAKWGGVKESSKKSKKISKKVLRFFEF